MKPVVYSEFTLRFIDFLAREAPDLHVGLSPHLDWEEEPTGFAVTELESPNEDVTADLWISTEEDEVTIGFDAMHDHFGRENYSSEEESFREAVSLARAFVDERVLVASWWIGEKWAGSRLIEPGQKPEPSDRIAKGSRLRIRSWTGRFDHDEKG